MGNCTQMSLDCGGALLFWGRERSRLFKVFLKQQILDFPELKEFADDNFKFDINGRQLSIKIENSLRKGEIAHYQQFLRFPVFSKCLYSTHVKTRACFGKG